MAVEQPRYLTHQDVCDAARCGARAYVRIVDPDTLNDLLFCAHHARQYHRVIEDGTFIVYDDRWILDLPLDASA